MMPCSVYLAHMSIRIEHITKSYGAQVAVNDISFEAKAGQITGFLGPNGAGKSTTMKMITGFLAPDAGEIWVDGVAVLKEPIAAKRKIGYLPESNALYYDMYVREYLRFTAAAHGMAKDKSAAEAALQRVGLLPEAHKKIGQLSKGYKQRVGIAAAIIHDPAVVILDEPTSGLDPNQIVDIRQMICELGKNKTVLLSTHIMQEVEAICDSVIIINKGNIVANDRLDHLTASQHQSLRVGFEEALETQWLQRLAGVDNVVRINTHTWELQGSDVDTIRRQVLQLAQTENLNITSIQKTGGSLEHIFRSLTVTVDTVN